MCSDLITVLAIGDRNKMESTAAGEGKGVSVPVSVLSRLGMAQHPPCRDDFALTAFSTVCLSCGVCHTCHGRKQGSLSHAAGAFKWESPSVIKPVANFCLALPGWDCGFGEFSPVCASP